MADLDIPQSNNALGVTFRGCRRTIQVQANQNRCNFVGGVFKINIQQLNTLNNNRLNCGDGSQFNIPVGQEVCVRRGGRRRGGGGNNRQSRLTVNGQQVTIRNGSKGIPRSNNSLGINFDGCKRTVQLLANQNSCNFVGGTFSVNIVQLNQLNDNKLNCGNGAAFNLPINQEICVQK